MHCQTYKNGETEPGYWDDPKPETHKVRDAHAHAPPLREQDDGDERALTPLSCSLRDFCTQISLDMYRKESRKILAVFSEFCPVVGASAPLLGSSAALLRRAGTERLRVACED